MMFSVIIPTYERAATLRQCLVALARQTYSANDFEVIVVDDGSTTPVAGELKGSDFPFKLVMESQRNAGAGAARNRGAGRAIGEILAFTEDDVVPDPDWLEKASDHFNRDPSIEVLEGKTVTSSTRTGIRRLDAPGIPSFIPCNLFVRAATFRQTGGYDPAFYDPKRHLYFREDADLGFRLLGLGAKVALVADVVVAHPVQFVSVHDAFRHARRYVFDALLYRKHPRLFRAFIEIKTILGVKVRRPQHLAALLALVVAGWVLLDLAQGPSIELIPLLAILAGTVLFTKFKYQGREGFRVRRLWDIPGFACVPALYLWSVTRGAVRYRSFGVLLP
jgi:glycosyltransferase involved in cell wall biosynthesis